MKLSKIYIKNLTHYQKGELIIDEKINDNIYKYKNGNVKDGLSHLNLYELSKPTLLNNLIKNDSTPNNLVNFNTSKNSTKNTFNLPTIQNYKNKMIDSTKNENSINLIQNTKESFNTNNINTNIDNLNFTSMKQTKNGIKFFSETGYEKNGNKFNNNFNHKFNNGNKHINSLNKSKENESNNNDLNNLHIKAKISKADFTKNYNKKILRSKKKISKSLNEKQLKDHYKDYNENDMENLFEIKEIKENPNNSSFMSIISQKHSDKIISAKSYNFDIIPKSLSLKPLKPFNKKDINNNFEEALTPKFVFQQIFNSEVVKEIDDYRKKVFCHVKNDMKTEDVVRLRHLIRKNSDRKVHEERLYNILKFNTKRKNIISYDDVNKAFKTIQEDEIANNESLRKNNSADLNMNMPPPVKIAKVPQQDTSSQVTANYFYKTTKFNSIK